jgi:hypothetical protein
MNEQPFSLVSSGFRSPGARSTASLPTPMNNSSVAACRCRNTIRCSFHLSVPGRYPPRLPDGTGAAHRSDPLFPFRVTTRIFLFHRGCVIVNLFPRIPVHHAQNRRPDRNVIRRIFFRGLRMVPGFSRYVIPAFVSGSLLPAAGAGMLHRRSVPTRVHRKLFRG